MSETLRQAVRKTGPWTPQVPWTPIPYPFFGYIYVEYLLYEEVGTIKK